MNTKLTISCLICMFSILCCSLLTAQEKEVRIVDKIYLKDGSTLIGHVTFGENSHIITLLDGQKLSVPKSTVKKVVQNQDDGQEETKPFNLENKRKAGIAHQIGISVITPGSNPDEYNFYINDNSSGGIQIDYAFQKFINRYFSAGLKVGLQKAYFIGDEDLNINVPVAVTFTNYFFTKFPSVYIDNTLGYNYIKNGNLETYGANKGGFFYAPGIGLRIPTRLDYNFLFGLGINFQHMETKQSNPWSSNLKKYEAKRYTVSLALQF